MRVTRPFHPLAGSEFDFAFRRKTWGEDRVFFFHEEGELRGVPAGWTDVASADPEEFLDARDLVQVKYEMVRRVRMEGQPVSAAATAFGFSRPSWYAAADALDASGLLGLLPARPGPPRAPKLTPEIMAFVGGGLRWR